MIFSTDFQSNDKKIGYRFLKSKLQLAVFEPKVAAEQRSTGSTRRLID